MKRDSLDFRNERIGRLFRAMFFPTLIGMVANSVLNLCDGMFVGHGVGSDALAAINIVAPFFLLCTGIGLMFGIGASVIGSIRLAEDNVKAARIIMTQAYIVGAVVFGTLILISLLFTHEVLEILGSSPRLEGLARSYLLWLLPGLFFFYLQCVGMMLIRLDGSPKYAMAVNVVAAVVNIFLDWLMVYPLAMGISGASIATSLSCILGGCMVLFYFLFLSNKLKFYRLKWSRKSLLLSLRNTGYMANIGFATFISEIAIGVTMVTGNYVFLERLGEDGVAAFSVGCYLFPLMFSISNAVATASQPILSFNYGAGESGRVGGTMRVALLTAGICGLIITCGMWGGAGPLTSIFLPSEATAYTLACEGLPLLGTCAVLFALNITIIGYYQSLERAWTASLFTALRGIIFIIPCFILLPRILGNSGLWLSIPTAEFLTLAALIPSYCHSRNLQNK